MKDNINSNNNYNTTKIFNNFMSCIFIPRYLVRHFHVLHLFSAPLSRDQQKAK